MDNGTPRLVVIESPYGTQPDGGRCTPDEIEDNAEYLRECMRDSLARGEAPYASHGLYPGVLDDNDPTDRRKGMDAGLAWGVNADLVAFYTGRGWTTGMAAALKHWTAARKLIEIRVVAGYKTARGEGQATHEWASIQGALPEIPDGLIPEPLRCMQGISVSDVARVSGLAPGRVSAALRNFLKPPIKTRHPNAQLLPPPDIEIVPRTAYSCVACTPAGMWTIDAERAVNHLYPASTIWTELYCNHIVVGGCTGRAHHEMAREPASG